MYTAAKVLISGQSAQVNQSLDVADKKEEEEEKEKLK